MPKNADGRPKRLAHARTFGERFGVLTMHATAAGFE